MKHFVWVSSILLATLLLLTCWVTDLNYLSTAQPVLATPSPQEPISPEDRKAMENIGIEFANLNYTYSYEEYLEAGSKVIPLLSEDFKEIYQVDLEKSYSAAEAVKAKSKVTNTQIISVEKQEANKGTLHLHFTAMVENNGIESIAKYSTELGLEKVGGQWCISEILSEQPVEFIELKNLL